LRVPPLSEGFSPSAYDACSSGPLRNSPIAMAIELDARTAEGTEFSEIDP
jgi:hypothetical protein